MGKQIATFPSLPASIQTVTLGASQFRVELIWRHRCAAWYLSLYALDGTALVLGRRLSAGWSPDAGLVLEGGPEGLFLVRGSDGYARSDLGANLKLLWYATSELLSSAADDGITASL